MNYTDVKMSSGYFREKATIGLSILTGNQIDRALMKATSHMLKAPKEKYVQILLAASYNHCHEIHKNGLTVSKYIVIELIKRLHTYNWVIVMKTVVVFHQLLSSGSDIIVQDICDEECLFKPLKKFSDTYDATFHKYFIEQYMHYLEARRIAQRFIGYNKRIETPSFEDYLLSLNAESLFPIFESLLRILETLVNIKYSENIVNNFCTMKAFEELLKDGKRLFKLLSTPVVFILGGFEEFPVPLKKIWLDLYARFTRAIGGLKIFFDSISQSSRVFTEEIPILRLPPENVLRDLEQDVLESEMPLVEVCTLESISIRKQEPQQVEKENLSSEEPQLQAATTENLNETSFESASGLPKVIVSMDELFGPTSPIPAQTCGQQINLSHIDPYFSTSEILANALPSEFAGVDWSSGAPAEWSPKTPNSDPLCNH